MSSRVSKVRGKNEKFKNKAGYIDFDCCRRCGIIIYPNVVNKIEQDPQEFSPAALLEEVMSHRQTTVLVFSYDAECCPGTQEFFAAYKEDVYHAMEPL